MVWFLYDGDLRQERVTGKLVLQVNMMTMQIVQVSDNCGKLEASRSSLNHRINLGKTQILKIAYMKQELTWQWVHSFLSKLMQLPFALCFYFQIFGFTLTLLSKHLPVHSQQLKH